MLQKNTLLKEVLKLAHPCKCNACTVGCRHGSGFLVNEDIQKMAEFLQISEDVLKKEFLEEVEKFNTKKFRPKIIRKNKPYGKCIFFDEKIGCKVHEAKPLECKIAMGCKDYGEELSLWFMLNHFVNENDAESVRQYAAYLKSGGKILAGAELETMVPDKEKLSKILSFDILR
ncbi:YkgJ family cysteine cluster protein [Candidatus Woesearchaeota archaeon]|nr:YkgJ family cysteine cluster protein [Candidatus Woesearchaeota archaeon]